jgi:hypothetical protein
MDIEQQFLVQKLRSRVRESSIGIGSLPTDFFTCDGTEFRRQCRARLKEKPAGVTGATCQDETIFAPARSHRETKQR